jgi:alcohol dehydrogenase class IV
LSEFARSSSAFKSGSRYDILQTSLLPGEFTFLPLEKVYFGPGSLTRLKSEAERLGSRRALIITGHSLASNTPLIKQVESLLGQYHQATYAGIRQHAPESGIKEALNLALDCQADLLISLGGGSPIDAAKIVVQRLAKGSQDKKLAQPYLPHIAIPTTLSAAEFSHVAGFTDEASRSKSGISDVNITPRVVIMDAEVTLWTPIELWLASGIRALDHAVETLYSPGNHPINDILALKAIEDLFKYLPLSKKAPDDLNIRQQCQQAAWMSYFAPATVGAHLGLSHTIGKRIGANYGVPHGVTSCILLGHVIRSKASQPYDAARLAPAATRLGLTPDSGSDKDAAIAFADAVQYLVRHLGLPNRLRDVNVPQAFFEAIAQGSASDEPGRAIVLDILRQAW